MQKCQPPISSSWGLCHKQEPSFTHLSLRTIRGSPSVLSDLASHCAISLCICHSFQQGKPAAFGAKRLKWMTAYPFKNNSLMPQSLNLRNKVRWLHLSSSHHPYPCIPSTPTTYPCHHQEGRQRDRLSPRALHSPCSASFSDLNGKRCHSIIPEESISAPYGEWTSCIEKRVLFLCKLRKSSNWVSKLCTSWHCPLTLGKTKNPSSTFGCIQFLGNVYTKVGHSFIAALK